MDNTLNYSTMLKNRYGEAFFINYLRSRQAPVTIRNSNQLHGMIIELLGYLRNQNDNRNAEVISSIENIAHLRRNTDDREQALDLLEHLGVHNVMPAPPRMIPESAFPAPTLRQTEDNDSIEKVSYLTGLPADAECPICLDNLDGNGYSTEKCRHFFHKQCLDHHCSGKRPCPCPICRRSLRFINRTGGKKRRTKKNRSNKKSKKTHKKSRASRKR